MARAELTHLDAANRPTMVDIGAKEVTLRTAVAEGAPAATAGGVGGTARQRPSHQQGDRCSTPRSSPASWLPSAPTLIPFCHPSASSSARSRSRTAATRSVRCRVSVHQRTGVEMEALTGASIAALTLYDMCRALSHELNDHRRAPAREVRRPARVSAPARPLSIWPPLSMAWCSPAAAAPAWARTRPRCTTPAARSSSAPWRC